ncbi:D-arabinose 5-phosphate isomerase [Methylophilus sp. TWE2]|nr:KpsF/GutQ family sugar-phosphate isomerase [Methylophilus sp. TWE2]AKR44274.1 D-arabinose 5-phosphate isomerase [Methylophilus sp. TWE2]
MNRANDGVHLVKSADIVTRARGILLHEADEIRQLADRLGSAFEAAVHMILDCRGRVVVTGMGKSGHIGGKIAATLASTGTPAFFMHPAEASHGDLGMITSEDVVIALSNSGESDEIINILPAIRRIGARILSITGSESSTLSRESEVHLSAAVSHEACPLGLAPTASTTAALALGDALALCVLDLRAFTAEDFARSHPGGSLGRRLLVRIKDVMRTGNAVPWVNEQATVQDAITQISSKGMGFTAIVDHQHHPIGIFTDGDLRRLFMQGKSNTQTAITSVMNTHPRLLGTQQMAVDAVNLMEQYKINGFLAVDEQQQLIGAFNMHDLLKAKVV